MLEEKVKHGKGIEIGIIAGGVFILTGAVWGEGDIFF